LIELGQRISASSFESLCLRGLTQLIELDDRDFQKLFDLASTHELALYALARFLLVHGHAKASALRRLCASFDKIEEIEQFEPRLAGGPLPNDHRVNAAIYNGLAIPMDLLSRFREKFADKNDPTVADVEGELAFLLCVISQVKEGNKQEFAQSYTYVRTIVRRGERALRKLELFENTQKVIDEAEGLMVAGQYAEADDLIRSTLRDMAERSGTNDRLRKLVGVITVPDRFPWSASGWAFRLILDRAISKLTQAEDIRSLEQAIALNELDFKILPSQQASRLASALLKGANDLTPELAQSKKQRDRGLARTLPKLIDHLRAVGSPSHAELP
jgi:hypothetical protein